MLSLTGNGTCDKIEGWVTPELLILPGFWLCFFSGRVSCSWKWPRKTCSNLRSQQRGVFSSFFVCVKFELLTCTEGFFTLYLDERLISSSGWLLSLALTCAVTSLFCPLRHWQEKMVSLETLPTELVRCIFDHLDEVSLYPLSMVSTFTRQNAKRFSLARLQTELGMSGISTLVWQAKWP